MKPRDSDPFDGYEMKTDLDLHSSADAHDTTAYLDATMPQATPFDNPIDVASLVSDSDMLIATFFERGVPRIAISHGTRPISLGGEVTEKFDRFRDFMASHVESLYPSEVAPDCLPSPVESAQRHFDNVCQGVENLHDKFPEDFNITIVPSTEVCEMIDEARSRMTDNSKLEVLALQRLLLAADNIILYNKPYWSSDPAESSQRGDGSITSERRTRRVRLRGNASEDTRTMRRSRRIGDVPASTGRSVEVNPDTRAMRRHRLRASRFHITPLTFLPGEVGHIDFALNDGR